MIQICGAPCCWGVDDPKNPYLPPWTRVLKEAGLAGYSAIELGPYGYLPIDAEVVSAELRKNGIGHRRRCFLTACITMTVKMKMS